jgi:hypothetical protein
LVLGEILFGVDVGDFKIEGAYLAYFCLSPTAVPPDDEDQTWLEQYGLIKRKEQKAVVANNIYKQRYIETFIAVTPNTTRQETTQSPP